MKVAVWDTYIIKKDSNVMHFDIIAPEEVMDRDVIYSYVREYLKTKGLDGQVISSNECRLCHIETLKPQWESEIRKKGYFVLEMENCN